MYALGGCGLDEKATPYDLSRCEQYDPNADTWIETASLNEGKYGLTACAFDMRFIYVFGGTTLTRGSVMTVEVMDCATPGAGWVRIPWNVKEPGLWSGRRCSAAVQVDKNSIIMFGGYNQVSLASVIRFNVLKNEFSGVEGDLLHVASFQQRKPVIYGETVYAPDFYYGNVHVYSMDKAQWRVVSKYNWTNAGKDSHI